MTQENDCRAYTSRPGRGRLIHQLPSAILQGIQRRAEAIGPRRAAIEMAVLSSVMLEGYTEEGRLRAVPAADYRAFAERADRVLPCRGDRGSDLLRRAIWDLVLQLADAVGPFVAMAELAMQCGLMIVVCREAGLLDPGPEVSPLDFAKRADGTSLL